MRTIFKRAAYLQPGDVLAAIGGYPRRVFRHLTEAGKAHGERQVTLWTADIEPPAPMAVPPGHVLVPPTAPRAPECWNADKPLQVEVADDALEPRELDLLAEVARMQLAIGLDPERQAALVELLNRVRPEPPSAEELLKLAERTLEALLANDTPPGTVALRDELEAMVDRARRTGVLPKATVNLVPFRPGGATGDGVRFE